MQRDEDARSRWLRAYGLSLIVHALGVFLFVLVLLFWNIELPDEATSVNGDVISVEVAQSPVPTPAPSIAPAPVPTVPQPILTTVPVAAIATAVRPQPRRHVPTPPPRPHELARTVDNAPANPTAPPTTIATEPPTSEPARVPTAAPTAAPKVLAIATPVPTSPPTIVPTQAPTAPPTVAPTAVPTVAPTIRPTVAPTIRPTVAPTSPPTVAPTVAPTIRPTIAPTQAPTSRPTEAPTALPTAAPTARATAPSTAAPTAVAVKAPAAAKAPGAGATHAPGTNGRGTGSPAPHATARANGAAGETHPAVAAGAPAPSATENASLNDRLRNLLPHGDVDYTPRRVDLGKTDEFAARVQAAYEAGLAPPPDILAKTFGIIWQKRNSLVADSISYVFERTTIAGIGVCKAYKITEHPYTGGPPDLRANPLADESRRTAPPDIAIVTIVPCSEKNYEPVAPGSLKTPEPRHRP